MLEIIRAGSLEQLGDSCAQILNAVPVDPFTSEWIATPTPGIGRWLALELARILGASGPGMGDGVAANITFARAGGLRRAILEAGSRASHIPDPWASERVTWTLCDLRRSEPAGFDLPALGHGSALTGWARRTAGLFGRYQRYRPEMIRAWTAGDDAGPLGGSLRSGERWQPRLFRSLRTRLGAPSPPERMAGLYAEVRAGTLDLDLPERLVLFGFSTPPEGPESVEVLEALSCHRDVYCYLVDPAPTVAPDQWNALVRSWGTAADGTRKVFGSLEGAVETIPSVPAAPAGTVLGRLQQAIATGAVDAAVACDTADESIHVHGAQGARRQVEVLRDALCARFAADPTLREDDIVVCCSDLVRFVPLIHSVLGSSAGSGSDSGTARAPEFRFRIDEDAGGPTNSVVDAVSAALELVTGRFSALDVVEFCGLDAVRHRWGFDDEALATIRRWVRELDVRWGFDTAQRASGGVPESIRAGTWRRALDRLALGVAFARDDLVVGDDLVPVGVEGGQIHLLGRLVDLVTRLADLAQSAAILMPVAERLEGLQRAMDAMVAPIEGAEWQLDALWRMCQVDLDDGERLSDWVGDLETNLSDVRPELLRRLRGGGRRSGAFRGGVTFTSPAALSGVPFRIVCLLGLDDVSVPGSLTDGDDLLTRTAQPGDPDLRSETMGSLLAAIGAATEALLVFHDDRDLTTNEHLDDGVALAELWAAIDEVTGPDTSASYRSSISVSHPRHATDPKCFVPGGIVDGRRWSFDPLALSGAQARLGQSDNPKTLRSAYPKPAQPASAGGAGEQTISVADLGSFFNDPAKFACRQVLGVRLPGDDDDLQAHLRTDLTGLEKYNLQDALLEELLEDPDDGTIDRFARLAVGRDHLPVGTLGTSKLAEIQREAVALEAQAASLGLVADEVSLPVQCMLADRRQIVGAVQCRAGHGRYQVFSAGARRMKIGDRLGVWVELLALAATYPDYDFTADLVRREGKNPTLDGSFTCRLASPGRVTPIEALSKLVGLFDAVHRQPVALSYEVFETQLFAAGAPRPVDGQYGEVLDDGHITKDQLNSWESRCRYSKPLAFLVGDRTLGDVLAEPARTDDPGSTDQPGRIGRFVELINAAWDATVDSVSPEAGPE